MTRTGAASPRWRTPLLAAIDPPDLAPVDHEYVLVRSEFYLDADGQPGDLARRRADRPEAVMVDAARGARGGIAVTARGAGS
jgi:nitrite reductase (NO-forming)